MTIAQPQNQGGATTPAPGSQNGGGAGAGGQSGAGFGFGFGKKWLKGTQRLPNLVELLIAFKL